MVVRSSCLANLAKAAVGWQSGVLPLAPVFRLGDHSENRVCFFRLRKVRWKRGEHVLATDHHEAPETLVRVGLVLVEAGDHWAVEYTTQVRSQLLK